MAWLGLAAALPFLLPLLRPVTDRLGWTRIKGKEKAMIGTALQGWNLAFFTEWHNAAEYQKACHDEEEHPGGKRRPHFPGICGEGVTIAPELDRPADLAFLAQCLERDPSALRRELLVTLPETSVAAIVTVDGRPAGYLQFGQCGERAWQVERLQGPVPGKALQLLAAYLTEFEGARSVTDADGCAIGVEQSPTFHLLLN